MGRTKFSTGTALALAAVLLSSSTTIYAVARIPKHSVGTKQLKPSAVTNTKIHPSAITSSKVKPNALGATAINESALGQVPSAANAGTAGNAARLEGLGAAAFVGSQRMAFGKGSASSTAVATVLSLTNVGVTVTTDGDVDTDAVVSVNLPMLSTISWVVAVEGNPTYSTAGGATSIATPGATNSFTAHIWRFDSSAGIYLHCAFDTSGFAGSAPLSCWAFST